MLTNEIDVIKLKERVKYHEDGYLIWVNPTSNRVKVGDKVGSINKQSGYYMTGISGKTYSVHRLVWLYHYGEFPKGNIDHRNRIKTDNRISNLRLATQYENMANTTPRKGCTSEYKGVIWIERVKKWNARVQYNNKTFYLGYFTDEDKAARAYNTKAAELFGEFAHLNEIRPR